MSWTDHVDIMSKKVNQRIGVIKRIKYLLPIEARQTIYNSLIIPLFDYGDILWGKKNNETLMNQLQTLQNKAAKVLLDQTPQSSATEAFSTLDWKPLSSRRSFHRLTTMHKCMHGGIDLDFSFMKNSSVHNYNTRSLNNLHLPRVRTVLTGENKGSFTMQQMSGTVWI